MLQYLLRNAEGGVPYKNYLRIIGKKIGAAKGSPYSFLFKCQRAKADYRFTYKVRRLRRLVIALRPLGGRR